MLPDKIIKTDYDQIEDELKKILYVQFQFKDFDVKEAFELFPKYYKLDENVVPGVYQLNQYESSSINKTLETVSFYITKGFLYIF